MFGENVRETKKNNLMNKLKNACEQAKIYYNNDRGNEHNRVINFEFNDEPIEIEID